MIVADVNKVVLLCGRHRVATLYVCIFRWTCQPGGLYAVVAGAWTGMPVSQADGQIAGRRTAPTSVNMRRLRGTPASKTGSAAAHADVSDLLPSAAAVRSADAALQPMHGDGGGQISRHSLRKRIPPVSQPVSQPSAVSQTSGVNQATDVSQPVIQPSVVSQPSTGSQTSGVDQMPAVCQPSAVGQLPTSIDTSAVMSMPQGATGVPPDGSTSPSREEAGQPWSGAAAVPSATTTAASATAAEKQSLHHNSVPDVFQHHLSSSSDPESRRAGRILAMLFTGNLIGILCSRTLHYQFYAWYYYTMPLLLWWSPLPNTARIALWAAIEVLWNAFPSTPASSMALLVCHVVLLTALWVSPRWLHSQRVATSKGVSNRPS